MFSGSLRILRHCWIMVTIPDDRYSRVASKEFRDRFISNAATKMLAEEVFNIGQALVA